MQYNDCIKKGLAKKPARVLRLEQPAGEQTTPEENG